MEDYTEYVRTYLVSDSYYILASQLTSPRERWQAKLIRQRMRDIEDVMREQGIAYVARE